MGNKAKTKQNRNFKNLATNLLNRINVEKHAEKNEGVQEEAEGSRGREGNAKHERIGKLRDRDRESEKERERERERERENLM